MQNKRIITLIALSIIFGSLFFSLRVLQYRSFFSFEWEDDARDNQVAYNIATSFTPYQTIFQKNTTQPKILNDHFTPVHYIVAIFYRIYPHIYTWYFVMCFSYGFGSLLIYLLAKNILKDEKVAFLISLIYLLFPPLHYASLGALDPRNFVLPFFILMFYYQHFKKFIPYLIFMVLVCMCKEDIPVYTFAFGLYQLVKKYPKMWWMSTLFFSTIYFFIAVYLSDTYCLIDIRERVTSIHTESYNYISSGALKNIIGSVFTNPGYLFHTMFTWEKMRFFVMILYPLMLLPLFSIELYIGMIITLVEIGLPNGFYNDNSYYAAAMVPFLFMALIYTMKKIENTVSRRKLLMIALILMTMCLIGSVNRNIIGVTARESNFFSERLGQKYDKRFLGVENIFDKKLYTVDSEDRIALEMIKMIPKNASAAVTGDLLPAASSRRYVYELGLDYSYDSDEYIQPSTNADFILINKKCLINGLGGHYECFSDKELAEMIKTLINEFHYSIKAEKGTFLLLEKRWNTANPDV